MTIWSQTISVDQVWKVQLNAPIVLLLILLVWTNVLVWSIVGLITAFKVTF